VVIACDCGTVVNPRGVKTQLEGGMIYGLSAAFPPTADPALKRIAACVR
jgi:hypothetical protein